MSVTLSFPYSALVSALMHAVLIGGLLFLRPAWVQFGDAVEVVYVGLNNNSTTQDPVQPVRKQKAIPQVPKNVDASKDAIVEKAVENQTANFAENVNGGSGVAIGSKEIEPYVQKVLQVINARKSYPEMARRLGQQGTIKIQFTIDRSGEILSTQILESTPYNELNKAAQRLVNGIGRFDPFPDNIKISSWEFVVPIEYRM